ncbi:hypothetical protein HAX54_053114 [Datura stramonium]|uniref:FCP1 homology domain-containing protein n=1 Tax=Datura stramonium TaxID=4076 RepID=A0ABS8WPA1_DATST|nr:hypothetical protein [Datura stramonium]
MAAESSSAAVAVSPVTVRDEFVTPCCTIIFKSMLHYCISDEAVDIKDKEINKQKLRRRVEQHKIVLLTCRVKVKAACFDIDYTCLITDLHEFLSAAYAEYDIMIWSATSMKWVELKMGQLGLIWAHFPEFYSPKNTIMFDDLRRNFVMNPQNGLAIKPFRKAHANRSSDQELMKLTQYLLAIADLDDLSVLDHKNWESFNEDSVKRRRHA